MACTGELSIKSRENGVDILIEVIQFDQGTIYIRHVDGN
ncbi:MAG: hypothetical protein HPY66_1529 [Firmicutes bacterium]|nr:hypothetical protein [Bacillota bacterium]